MVAKKSTSLKVDFSGVESGGFDIPDGIYALTVSSVTQKKGAETGQPYLSFEYKVAEGKYKGRKVWDNVSLQPQALWKLRNLLECMGMEVEDGEFEIELEDLEQQGVGAEIANEKYQGKDKPRIVGYLSPDAMDDSEEEEEEEKPASKPKNTKVEKEPEPEEDGGEEEEEEKPTTTRKKKTTTEEPELKVGSKVTFEDDGEMYEGKILSVEEETVTVKVGKDEWELGKDEVTLI